MKTPIRVAIVGCGNIARRAHVPAWLDKPEVKIVALCDPSIQAMKQITERHQLDCSLHQDFDEMLETVRPDVVDVCSPTPFHYPLAKRALESGAHVLLEKPPAQTLQQATELDSIARAKGLKLGVSFNYRYRDLVHNLKQTQQSGVLGEIVKVHITHHGPLIFTDAEWTWDERKSRYLLWESGIHFLDILVHLFGPHEEIISVVPTVHPGIKHTTDIEVIVRFANGGTGRLEIVADSTRHSSFFTELKAYGTAADAFVRWFPASMMIVSGQVNPFALLLNEVKAIWELGTKVLTGQFIKQRNISHYRLIGEYVDWLAGKSDFALKMENALPTLRLLSEISERIPAYREANEMSDIAVVS